MALSAPALSAALRAAFVDDGQMTDNDAATDFCDTLAEVLLAHLTANAVINPGTMAAGGDAVTGAGTLS